MREVSCSIPTYPGIFPFVQISSPRKSSISSNRANTPQTPPHFPSGKYSTTVGATSSSTCENCLAGRYSSSAASSTCTDCAASTYSVAGSAFCTSCLAGKSAESGGTSDEICVDCVSGRYSPGKFFSDVEFLARDLMGGSWWRGDELIPPSTHNLITRYKYSKRLALPRMRGG